MAQKLQGTLVITLLRATNLANKDTVGFSDPYVKLKATSSEQRPLLDAQSKTIEDNLNPVWNERFSVPIDEATASVILDLEVFDKDSIGADEPLGFVKLDINAGFAFNSDIDRDLQKRNKEEVKGKLFCKIEYRVGQQVKLNDTAPKKEEAKKSIFELPNEARQSLKEWRAAKDVFTADEETKMALLIDIYQTNFGCTTPVFDVETSKFAGFLFEYKKAKWPVSSEDTTPMKWTNSMKDNDGDFVNEAKDIIGVVCSFQIAKKSSYRDGYLNDPEGLFCEELKVWASKELSIKSIGKDALPFLDKRVSYLESCLLVPDLFDSTSSVAKETIQQLIVKVRRILKYRALAAVEKELAHEDATRSFNDLKKHLAGLVRSCAEFLKHVFRCETPAETLSTADRLLLTVESDANIRQVLGDDLKNTIEQIKGIANQSVDAPWQTIDLREQSLHPTLNFLDPVKLDVKDPLLPFVLKGLNSGVEEFFRGNSYIAFHFLKAHGLLMETGRLFVVIEKAANCAKTGGTLLVFGLANAQLNATLDSTKSIMDLVKDEFNSVAKIAECCFEELVFKNQATKERTEWIKHFKNVFPGINEINDAIEKIHEEVAEIKETANSMTLYERFQQAADENKEFLNTADQFSERMAQVTGKPYTKPKPKEMNDDDTQAMMRLISGT